MILLLEGGLIWYGAFILFRKGATKQRVTADGNLE